MRAFKNALVVGFAGAALLGATTIASALTLNTTVNIDVYQGAGGGSIFGAAVQAQQGNPLIAPANLLGTGTYSGDLDFFQAATNTIGAFLNSGGGVLSAGLLTATVQNATLSTAPFAITTVMVITGTTASILSGVITHDDGMSLYDGPGYSNPVALAPFPVVPTPTAYAGLFGNWQLIYVEANGLPAQLTFDVTRSEAPPNPTPLPAAVWLLGSVLAGGAGFGRWRKRKAKSAAIAPA
jgi:hypothetical protein